MDLLIFLGLGVFALALIFAVFFKKIVIDRQIEKLNDLEDEVEKYFEALGVDCNKIFYIEYSYTQLGKTYNHYTASGDLIDEGIDSETVNSLISSGILVKGQVPSDQKLGTQFTNTISLLKERISKVAGLFKDVTSTVGNTVSGFFNKVKSAESIITS